MALLEERQGRTVEDWVENGVEEEKTGGGVRAGSPFFVITAEDSVGYQGNKSLDTQAHLSGILVAP